MEVPLDVPERVQVRVHPRSPAKTELLGGRKTEWRRYSLCSFPRFHVRTIKVKGCVEDDRDAVRVGRADVDMSPVPSKQPQLSSTAMY